jgi:hypothetical protein
LTLEFDLDEHALCGVGIGDPLEQLAFLGPGRPCQSGIAFSQHGIEVSSDFGLLTELIVYFGHPAEPQGGKFVGTIRHRRRPLALPPAITEQWARGCLGEPYWRDQDECEVILFYEHGLREWQLEFASDGLLKCWLISEPTLADPVQREAYGVTRTWPHQQGE